MIARIWRGWAAPEQADDYQRHYETVIVVNLRTVDGFRGAQLLRRADGDEVLFTAITWFTSLNAIRDFAGEDYEQAVMEEPAITALTRWDERVIHHVVEINVLALGGLAADPGVARHAGKCLTSGQMGRIYGVTDTDGSRPDGWSYVTEIEDPGLPAWEVGYR